MVSNTTREPRRSSNRPLPLIGLVLALLSPVTVFAAILGLKAGLWPIGVAYDLLTMRTGAGLAALGIAGALAAVLGGVRSMRSQWPAMAASVLIVAVTTVLFSREFQTVDGSRSQSAGVSTNAGDPVNFPPDLMEARAAAGADPLSAASAPNGCAIHSLPSQVAPGVAAYGLQKAGFTVGGVSVARGEGTYVSPWFDRTYDAVIRIRPGQTDVRVAPRDGVHDHGTSCRLARRIITNMQ